MLKVIIRWTYYEDSPRYTSWGWKQKKECVYFYDYDSYVEYIINDLPYSELQKLRLNIYNKYQKLIKFTRFWEIDKDWNKFEGYKLESPIIDIDNTTFAGLIPNNSIRKKFFLWDSVREKYFLKSRFINYIQLNVI